MSATGLAAAIGVSATDSAAGQSSAEMVGELHTVVAEGQRRWKRLIVLEAAGLAVATPLAYLWLVFLIDNVIHLAVWGRVLAIVLFIAALAWTSLRLVRSWKLARFTQDQVALAIERRTPGGLQNRLINAIQLSRDAPPAPPGGARDITRVVVEENYRVLKQLRLQQSAESRPAVLRIGLAGVVIVAGLAFFILGHDRFTNAASRIFMPFADVAPLYQTRLKVEPGDRSAAVGDMVRITIQVDGKIPREVVLLSREGREKGGQNSKALVIDPASHTAVYTVQSIQRSLDYAVRGGDFTSRYYHIDVPMPLAIDEVKGSYHFPPYTRQADQAFSAQSGDLEALRGTHAAVTFTLNQPAKEAWMLLETPGVNGSTTQPAVARVALKQVGASQFDGSIDFESALGYRLESRNAKGEMIQTGEHVLRVVEDKAPALKLAGVDLKAEVMVDAVLPLKVSATDDYGLEEVGLFYRKAARTAAGGATQPAATSASGEWKSLQIWPVGEQAVSFAVEHPFPVGLLGLAEGDEIELALRAKDTDPLKGNAWNDGEIHALTITSEGAGLQLTYEKILRSEVDLAELIEGHKALAQEARTWAGKAPAGGGDGADDKAFADAVAQQTKTQTALREEAARVAREMVAEAGSLRLSVGMLADTEMVRAMRILDAVMKRPTSQERRNALTDARQTQERTERSLEEMLEHYVQFRKDWEMSHMLPFIEMMAQRQQRMAEASKTYAAMPAAAVGEMQRQATARRQTKLIELCGLVQKALAGMAERTEQSGAKLSEAFKAGAQAFDKTGVKSLMQQAAQSVGQGGQGGWAAAEPVQRQAADILAAIHHDLKKAKAEAAQLALADLQQLAKSDAEAQKRLKQLLAGDQKNAITADPNKLDLNDIARLQEEADKQKKKFAALKSNVSDLKFSEDIIAYISKTQTTAEQNLDILTLAKKPTAAGDFPDFADREANAVEAGLKDTLKDLAGDLLEEEEKLEDDFETMNLNMGWGPIDPGDVAKTGGSLNSTGATATTGNQKPPKNNVGGVSGSGRQGARSHGLVAGDESVNRRGRDEVQEGQQEAADQKGVLKQKMSKDPQKDASTGVGGKVVDDPHSHFSTHDAGEWKDEYADKLLAPRAVNQIVERKGRPLDPKVADRMRDMNHRQEQLIQRIKAIKKEYDKLYLPTDHLDEIAEQLKINLDRLKEKPDEDVFRKQVQTLDQLKGAVVVFDRPSSQYEQSLPREQVMRGRILDEAARPATPGYEDAVKRYYERLSERGVQ